MYASDLKVEGMSVINAAEWLLYNGHNYEVECWSTVSISIAQLSKFSD